jgi:hypothetical protein
MVSMVEQAEQARMYALGKALFERLQPAPHPLPRVGGLRGRRRVDLGPKAGRRAGRRRADLGPKAGRRAGRRRADLGPKAGRQAGRRRADLGPQT